MNFIKNKMSDRPFWILSGIMFTVAGILRFYNLHLDSLWLDEIMTWDFAHYPIDVIFMIRQRDFNTPLFDILQKISIAIFSVHDVVAIRFLAAVFGIGGVVAVFMFCKRHFGMPAATLTLAYLSTSVTDIYYSREARPYSMMFFASVLSVYFAFEMLQKAAPKAKTILFYSISVLLLSYSHYGGLLLAFWICLGVQCVSFFYRRNIKHTLAANFLVFLGYLPWLATAFRHTGEIPVWIGDQNQGFLTELDKFMFETFWYKFALQAYVILSLLFILYKCKKSDRELLRIFFILNLMFFVPFIFTFAWLTWIAPRGILHRHIMSFAAPLVLAAGFMVTALLNKKIIVLAAAALLFFFQLWNVIYGYQYYGHGHKSDLRAAAEWLSKQPGIDRTPIVGVNFRSQATDYYLQKSGLKTLHLKEAFDPAAAEKVWNQVKDQNKIYVLESFPDNPKTFLDQMAPTHEHHLAAGFFQFKIYELDKKP
jgi:hypothetical protein